MFRLFTPALSLFRNSYRFARRRPRLTGEVVAATVMVVAGVSSGVSAAAAHPRQLAAGQHPARTQEHAQLQLARWPGRSLSAGRGFIAGPWRFGRGWRGARLGHPDGAGPEHEAGLARDQARPQCRVDALGEPVVQGQHVVLGGFGQELLLELTELARVLGGHVGGLAEVSLDVVELPGLRVPPKCEATCFIHWKGDDPAQHHPTG